MPQPGDLQAIRRATVAQLAELERERRELLRRGHPVRARSSLKAFQALARLLEEIDRLAAGRGGPRPRGQPLG